jgi:outer membrane protein insertion porin family
MSARALVVLAVATMLGLFGPSPAGAAAPVVTAIDLVSPQQLPRDQVLAAIGPLTGQPRSRSAVRESLNRLWALGLFDAVMVEEHEDGDGVKLVYHLRRRPWIESLRWTGDFGVDPADLASAARLALGGDGDDHTIEDARKRLLSVLHSQGFMGARVEPLIVTEPATNGRRLTMVVTAGRPARLGLIRIKGAGQLTTAKIGRAFGLTEGDRYRERAVRDGVEAVREFLHREDFFDASVHATTFPWDPATNQVGIELEVNEGPRYEVEFSGNEALSARTLSSRLGLADRGPIDTFVVDTAARAIEAAYHERGYAFVKASGTLQERNGARLIKFDVSEGPRAFVKQVDLTGNLEVPARSLLERMQLRPGRWFATPFRADLLESDVRTLQAYLRAQGFADAVVGPARVSWSDDRTQATIAIPIVEGPRLRVGAIRVEGASLIEPDKILAAVPLARGSVWDPERADEGARAIRRLYDRIGAQSTEIRVEAAREDGVIGVTYAITEGPQTRIGRVLVRGALITRPSAIHERLPFKSGDPLDPDSLLLGQSYLADLGVFERVDVEPLQAPETPFADVEVTVRERKPWRFEFGAGYGTDEGVRGFVEVGYDNLFGTGRGLRLRQKLNVGGEASAFGVRTDLIYREPWVFGTHWDGEGRLFWEYREALGYDFERAGIRAQMAGALWREHVNGLDGSVWYRYYDIRRFNINPDLADSTIVAGRDQVASVAAALVLDRRDAPLNPTRGSLNFVSFETAAEPLGGSVSFVKARLETAWAFSLLPPTVLSLAARVGLATPFANSQELPIEDRFYAGGANTVRGYREQRVGPLDSDRNPLGGNGLIVLNAEWRFPIWRFLGGAVFIDAGQVTSTVRELGLNQFQVGTGGGLRLNTPVGPVRLDFGYALNEIPGENRFQFYLAIGNPF